MPNLVTALLIDRVDLVEEGANSEAFIQLFKRKEPMLMDYDQVISSMDETNAAIIKSKVAELETANTTLAASNETLNTDLTVTKSALAEKEAELKAKEDKEKEDLEKTAFDEEEVMKSLPEPLKAVLASAKARAAVAEEELKKAKEVKDHEEAVTKAAQLKSLPVKEEDLITVLKSKNASFEAILFAAAKALDENVLVEKGHSKKELAKTADSAWDAIEVEAQRIQKSTSGITKEAAIKQAMNENPDLYDTYVRGGK